MARILAALSGGVDSAVAALLLREQGHEVVGAHMRTWMHEEGTAVFADCPWGAVDLARTPGPSRRSWASPFHLLNLIEDYRARVVDYLVAGYAAGQTPNPDCMCNREIKFGVPRRSRHAPGLANSSRPGIMCAAAITPAVPWTC